MFSIDLALLSPFQNKIWFILCLSVGRASQPHNVDLIPLPLLGYLKGLRIQNSINTR